MRPAPGTPAVAYDDPQLIAPDLSPHAFIETTRGTIEFELAVLDAPQTTRNFIALAEKLSGKELDAFFQAWLFSSAKPPYPGR